MEHLSQLNLDPSAYWTIGTVVILYSLMIAAFGGYFSRFSKNINDYFYSGQRFAWWLGAASMIATGIGSYSYLKYSQQGFETGMSSSMTYTNDWFIIPFFMFFKFLATPAIANTLALLFGWVSTNLAIITISM